MRRDGGTRRTTQIPCTPKKDIHMFRLYWRFFSYLKDRICSIFSGAGTLGFSVCNKAIFIINLKYRVTIIINICHNGSENNVFTSQNWKFTVNRKMSQKVITDEHVIKYGEQLRKGKLKKYNYMYERHKNHTKCINNLTHIATWFGMSLFRPHNLFQV